MSQIDLGPEGKDLKDPKKNIKSGFMWIGMASICSQVLDAVSLLIVMMYISKEDMGLATLAVSYTACFDAFGGLGVGPALIQDSRLTEDETHSLFWFTILFGILFCVVGIPLVWPIAWLNGSELLIPMLLAGFIKIFVSSAARVPDALVTRRLQYDKTTKVKITTMTVSSLFKIVFAILGFGAWALVGANVLYNICYIILIFYFSKYCPKWHFSWNECKRFVNFGYKQCFSNLLETFNKNLHYFIIGNSFGEALLGVYRVGYELAMTPALAFLNVVNSSSYPVFAKLKDKRDELSKLFAWNQGNLAIFSAVPIVFIFFCAEDIFTFINEGQWMDAISFLPFALGIAFVKSLMQTFPELYRACTHPENSFRAAGVETLLVLAVFPLTLMICRYLELSEGLSLNILLSAWLGTFIPLFMFHRWVASRYIDIGFRSTVQNISKALLFIAVSSGLSVVPWIFRNDFAFSPWLHMIVEVLIMLACLGIYVKKLKGHAGRSK